MLQFHENDRGNYQPNGDHSVTGSGLKSYHYFSQISLLSKDLEAEFEVSVGYPVGDVKYDNGWAKIG